MGFEKGNRLWETRSKHGRGILFSSSDLLWTAACEYFKWADDNPWRIDKWVGKNSEHKTARTARPYNWSALCFYLGCSNHYFNEFKKNAEPDFLEVIGAIEQVMYSQKFEGAAAGAFNANIISRELGLIDRTEAKVVGSGESGAVEVTLNL